MSCLALVSTHTFAFTGSTWEERNPGSDMLFQVSFKFKFRMEDKESTRGPKLILLRSSTICTLGTRLSLEEN